jgi:hypothetical protein
MIALISTHIYKNTSKFVRIQHEFFILKQVTLLVTRQVHKYTAEKRAEVLGASVGGIH